MIDAVRDLDHQIATALRGVSGSSDLFTTSLSIEALAAIRSSLKAILAKHYTELAKLMRAKIASELSIDYRPSITAEISAYVRLIRNSDRFLRYSLQHLTDQICDSQTACARAKDLLLESRNMAKRIEQMILKIVEQEK